MPKWLFDIIDSRLLPQSDSRMPCAMVMLAGMPYRSMWATAMDL